MRPQFSIDIEDFIAKLALDRDRKSEARAAAGLDREDISRNRKADIPSRRRGPVEHRVPRDVREYVVPDFRPQIDQCVVELRTSNVEVMHWQGPGGSVLCVDDAGEQVVVVFLGLDTLPFGDITMAYPRRGDGTRPRFEARALTTDDFGRGAIAATPFAAPSGRGVLAEFWAFDADNEVVEVMRNPENGGEADVTVSPTPDGRDAMVIIDGHATAILRGAPTASHRNVRVVASAD